MNDKIHYSQHWRKLNDKCHTTIRKHFKWTYGQILREFVKGKYLQDVKVVEMKRIKLIDIDPEVLMKDTESSSFEEAINKLQDLKRKIEERYKKAHVPYNMNELFTVYSLKIIDQVRLDNWMDV